MIEEYSVEEVDSAITYVDDAAMPNDHVDLIIDALLFYKEMHFPNG